LATAFLGIIAAVPSVMRVHSEALARKVTRLSAFALATWTISAATIRGDLFLRPKKNYTIVMLGAGHISKL
jgi:hypothetical protein